MSLQFSTEAKERFDAIVAKYPQRQAALLPVLHLAQSEFGHLSIDVQRLVAETLEVPPVLVHEVTTFYEMYHEHEEGQFNLELCTNISCHLGGADSLMEHVKKKLGIEIGAKTEDGLFSLMEAECVASCGSGPTMRVGMDYYEHLTPEAVDHLIAKFRMLAPSLNGKPYECGSDGPRAGPVAGFEPPKPQVNSSEPVAEEPDEDKAEAKPEASDASDDAKDAKATKESSAGDDEASPAVEAP